MALVPMHCQCSRKSESVLLPLQVVGFEGSVPVTSLAAGGVPGIVLFWYRNLLFCECDSRLDLFSFFIDMGNFLTNVA